MIAKWERQTKPYQIGENYRLGRVVVGSAFHSWTSGEDEPQEYGSRVELPGIKTKKKIHMTMEDAKMRVERAVGVWLGWAGLDNSN